MASSGFGERSNHIRGLEEGLHWFVLKSEFHIDLGCVSNPGVEESLLVIRGLGIQTSTSSSMYWSSAATRFIPTTQIQDIVIHEAFKGFEVRFYLAIIVEGESGVVVVFPVNKSLARYERSVGNILTKSRQNLLPKRTILEEVWRGARQCLYESKTGPLFG